MREAFETCVSATTYIQHNLNIADGREAAIKAVEPKFGSPAFHAEVKRIVVNGQHAVVHLFARGQPDQRGAAVAHTSVLKTARLSSIGMRCS